MNKNYAYETGIAASGKFRFIALPEFELASFDGTDEEVKWGGDVRGSVFGDNLKKNANLLLLQASRSIESGDAVYNGLFVGMDENQAAQIIVEKLKEMAAISSAAWWVENRKKLKLDNEEFSHYGIEAFVAGICTEVK